MPELPHGVKFNGSVYVQIYKDGSGEVDFSGVVTETGEHGVGKSSVQRTIAFEYVMLDSGTVRLSEARLRKKSADTMPDDFFTKAIYDSSEPEKRMHVSKLQNAYLIGNIFHHHFYVSVNPNTFNAATHMPQFSLSYLVWTLQTR